MRGGEVVQVVPYSELLMPSSIGAGRKALEDVAEWLGFERGNDYLVTLEREGPEIFKRATY